jgi:NAD(P)-dependent dehydrogenase (short-subunit alcohol dehydrogenase family)
VSTNEELFKDEIDPKLGKLMAPSLRSIDINLNAHIYVAKCAEHYFRKWPETRCQIVFTGSAASFLDTPPMNMYSAAKAGILGLMRAMRTQLIKKNITVNMIAPWMTGMFRQGNSLNP